MFQSKLTLHQTQKIRLPLIDSELIFFFNKWKIKGTVNRYMRLWVVPS